MIILIIISCLLVVTSIVCYNLLKKNETLEDMVVTYSNYIEKISDIIDTSDKKLQEIDEKGAFKSDDEVGFFFNNLKEIQEILNEFKTK